MSKMKIRVTLAVEIDGDEYANTYGLRPGDVREDVKVTAAQAVYDQLLRAVGGDPVVKLVSK